MDCHENALQSALQYTSRAAHFLAMTKKNYALQVKRWYRRLRSDKRELGTQGAEPRTAIMKQLPLSLRAPSRWRTIVSLYG